MPPAEGQRTGPPALHAHAATLAPLTRPGERVLTATARAGAQSPGSGPAPHARCKSWVLRSPILLSSLTTNQGPAAHLTGSASGENSPQLRGTRTRRPVRGATQVQRGRGRDGNAGAAGATGACPDEEGSPARPQGLGHRSLRPRGEGAPRSRRAHIGASGNCRPRRRTFVGDPSLRSVSSQSRGAGVLLGSSIRLSGDQP